MNNAVLIFVLSVSANFGASFCADLECSFDRSAFDLETMRRSKSGSVQPGGGQQSIAFKCKSCRGIFDSTASYRQHRIHHLAQSTGCSDPSNMAEFTFQQRGDMATGILRELDPLGETLEQLFSLFPIILIILSGIIGNNWE